MYKYVLCWRYLKTRYLAFACIVSVMLGVATLIVVNSVMSGFSTKLRERLHYLLSDVVIEAQSLEGFTDAGGKMARIKADPFLGPRVEAMTATMEVFAMLTYALPASGEKVSRPVRLIGIDPESRTAVGGFKEHLVRQQHNPGIPNFELSEGMKQAQRHHNEMLEHYHKQAMQPDSLADPNAPPPPMPTPEVERMPTGAIVGHLIAHFRSKELDPKTGKPNDVPLLVPGDSIILTTVSGQRLQPAYDSFVVVDYFQSEMSEYDGNYIFVPLDYLQQMRTLPDRVTSIQIKLTDYTEAKAVVAALKTLFDREHLRVETWEDKQGPLLAAIDIEKGILNVLLFLIIAVAGFGILAIFSMIVSEKTRDIGILKALGAPSGGVAKIFITYGFLLGVVGALLGSALGLTITYNINEVEQGLSYLTGHDVFNRTVYYFKEIPTHVQTPTVLLVNLGAVVIAVLFSVLPAVRASRLQPVQALRYE